MAVKEKTNHYKATDYGFTAVINHRNYEVRGITKHKTKLKASVKGIVSVSGKPRVHVDTVDFYSARSRAFLTKGLCDLFEVDETAVNEDLQQLMQYAESYQP